MAYIIQFLIPALLNPIINKMADASSAILLSICLHEVWLKVAYDWSTVLCICLCLCKPCFHLSKLWHKHKHKHKKNEVFIFPTLPLYHLGKMKKTIFPETFVHVKDNNSPHDKFHQFLFPFSIKFPELNFAELCMLSIFAHVIWNLYMTQIVCLGYLWDNTKIIDTWWQLISVEDFQQYLNCFFIASFPSLISLSSSAAFWQQK